MGTGVVVTVTATGTGATRSDGGDVVVLLTETLGTTTDSTGGQSYVVAVRLPQYTDLTCAEMRVDCHEPCPCDLCSRDTDGHYDDGEWRIAAIRFGGEEEFRGGLLECLLGSDRAWGDWDYDRDHGGGVVRLWTLTARSWQSQDTRSTRRNVYAIKV
jgi:hypothetical protein